MQTLQTQDFIDEARRLSDFYGGVASVLDDAKGDDDFKFLAAAFGTLNADAARYDFETAAVAHAADLFEHCKDGEQIRRRAFALRGLIRLVGEAGIDADAIKAITDSLKGSLPAAVPEAVQQ